jgi:type II secretion system protein H
MMSDDERRPAAGFTLMELVVVIALLGVLAVAATPMLNGRRVVSTLDGKQTAELLVSNLRMARTTAIMNGAPVYLITDREGFGVLDANGQPLQPRHLYAPDLQVTWSVSTIAFQPTGMSDLSLQVRIANAIRQWSINVLSASGQVSMTEAQR